MHFYSKYKKNIYRMCVLLSIIVTTVLFMASCQNDSTASIVLDVKNSTMQSIEIDLSKVEVLHNNNGELQKLTASDGKFILNKNISADNLKKSLAVTYDGVRCEVHSVTKKGKEFSVVVVFDETKINTHRILVRNTQFGVPEGLRAFIEESGRELEVSFIDDYYPYATMDAPRIKGHYVVETGYQLTDLSFSIDGYDIVKAAPSRLYSNSGAIVLYALDSDKNLSFDDIFTFSGRVVDAFTNEIGIEGVEIRINDVLIHVTDLSGNYDIAGLFEPTLITFSRDGYIFNPPFALATETVQGYRIREVIQS